MNHSWMSAIQRSANSVEKMQVFWPWSSLRMSACTVPRTEGLLRGGRPLLAGLVDRGVEEHREDRRRRAVDRHAHRRRRVRQVEARVQHLHVVERRDRHARGADLAVDVGPLVGIGAVERHRVERSRQSRRRLPVGEQVEATVRARRVALAGEHPGRVLALALEREHAGRVRELPGRFSGSQLHHLAVVAKAAASLENSPKEVSRVAPRPGRSAPSSPPQIPRTHRLSHSPRPHPRQLPPRFRRKSPHTASAASARYRPRAAGTISTARVDVRPSTGANAPGPTSRPASTNNGTNVWYSAVTPLSLKRRDRPEHPGVQRADTSAIASHLAANVPQRILGTAPLELVDRDDVGESSMSIFSNCDAAPYSGSSHTTTHPQTGRSPHHPDRCLASPRRKSKPAALHAAITSPNTAEPRHRRRVAQRPEKHGG